MSHKKGGDPDVLAEKRRSAAYFYLISKKGAMEIRAFTFDGMSEKTEDLPERISDESSLGSLDPTPDDSPEPGLC